MLAALLLPCAAALLARATPAHAHAPLYTTQLEKSTAGAAALRTAGFSIPRGQCSGYIDQSLLCGAGRAAAVRLRVRDAAFAALRVDDALRSATVTRTLCHAPADVELAVACEPDATGATGVTGATGDSGARFRRHAPRALPPAR